MDAYLITEFTFMPSDSDDLTGLEFVYEDEAAMAVYFLTGTLAVLDDELTASLERNVERRGGGPSNWPLQIVGRKPSVRGPEYEVMAVRVTRVRFFERLDGERITIIFDHAENDPTIVTLTTHAAQLLVQATRNRIANAKIGTAGSPPSVHGGELP